MTSVVIFIVKRTEMPTAALGCTLIYSQFWITGWWTIIQYVRSSSRTCMWTLRAFFDGSKVGDSCGAGWVLWAARTEVLNGRCDERSHWMPLFECSCSLPGRFSVLDCEALACTSVLQFVSSFLSGCDLPFITERAWRPSFAFFPRSKLGDAIFDPS